MYWKHTLNATSLHNLPPINFFKYGFPIALIDPERRELDHCNWRGLSTTIKNGGTMEWSHKYPYSTLDFIHD